MSAGIRSQRTTRLRPVCLAAYSALSASSISDCGVWAPSSMLDTPRLAVTASLGVSSIELGAQTPQSLIDEADKALYAAKQTGRNRVVRWDRMPADMEAEKLAAAAVASELAGDAAHGAAPAPQAGPPTIPFGAVTALMSALRYRDAATAAHTQRVADLCVMLAKDRMPVRECFVLEVAAL